MQGGSAVVAFVAACLFQHQLFAAAFAMHHDAALLRPSSATPVSRGVSAELLKRYDAFLIDQWGVLHDGKKPYPGALALLEAMRSAGKHNVMISNSSKRDVRDGMCKVGIDSSRYFDDRIVTSGQLAFELLSNRARLQSTFPSCAATTSKLRVFVFGSGEGDKEFVQGSGHEWAASPEDADLLLARGTFAIGDRRFEKAEETMEHVDAVLVKCAARRLPLIVSNPDFHRPGSGSPMPGQIARRYKSLLPDGVDLIHQIGKPYASVFEAGVTMLPPGIKRERICMVGDSIDHDVLGAKLFGIDSIWITNGVHASTLGVSEGSPIPPSADKLGAFLQDHSTYLPTWQVAAFQLDESESGSGSGSG